jgi:hypothetical protein
LTTENPTEPDESKKHDTVWDIVEMANGKVFLVSLSFANREAAMMEAVRLEKKNRRAKYGIVKRILRAPQSENLRPAPTPGTNGVVPLDLPPDPPECEGGI